MGQFRIKWWVLQQTMELMYNQWVSLQILVPVRQLSTREAIASPADRVKARGCGRRLYQTWQVDLGETGFVGNMLIGNDDFYHERWWFWLLIQRFCSSCFLVLSNLEIFGGSRALVFPSCHITIPLFVMACMM